MAQNLDDLDELTEIYKLFISQLNLHVQGYKNGHMEKARVKLDNLSRLPS